MRSRSCATVTCVSSTCCEVRGVDSLADSEKAVQVLADERLRAEFVVKLKEFNRTQDDVLPRPEGLEFVNDAKQLAYIHALARNRYKDTPAVPQTGSPPR